MDEPIGRYFVYNDSLVPIESLSNVMRSLGDSVYEVIRIIKNTPLFLVEHITRLDHSASLFGCKKRTSLKEIRELAAVLIGESGVSSGNIKIVYGESKDKSRKILLIHFIKSHYPDDDMYKSGVSVGVLRGERISPNIKQSNTTIRKKADAVLRESLYYEILLENEDGYITEGSRTNIFLIKDDIFYTPPIREVLSGITRQKVIEISERGGITLIEQSIPRSDLSQFDTLFLTGTSVKVLPIRFVENLSFVANHPLLKYLIESYDECIASYIEYSLRTHRAVSNKNKFVF